MSRETIETEYNRSDRPVYTQMFLGRTPDVLSELNELYDEEDWNGNKLSDVAEEMGVHRETLPEPVTEDGYQWFDEVVREGDGRVERYSPFHDYDGEIAVLFPWSQDFEHEEGELQLDRSIAVYAEEQVSDEEAEQFLRELNAAMEDQLSSETGDVETEEVDYSFSLPGSSRKGRELDREGEFSSPGR